MSQETLARMTGLSTRSVRRAISELAELGELDVIADSGQTRGARKTNRYFLTVLCPSNCDSSYAHKLQEGGEVVDLATARRAIEDKIDSNRGQL